MKVISSKDGLTAKPVNPFTLSSATPMVGLNAFESYHEFDAAHPALPLTQPMPGETVFEVEEIYQMQDPETKEWGTVRYLTELIDDLDSPVRKSYQPVATPIKEVANEEKAGEEVITLNLSDFYLTMQDVERAFCFGYITNPDNDCLNNAEMMRRWQAFKTEYLDHKTLE